MGEPADVNTRGGKAKRRRGGKPEDGAKLPVRSAKEEQKARRQTATGHASTKMNPDHAPSPSSSPRTFVRALPAVLSFLRIFDNWKSA